MGVPLIWPRMDGVNSWGTSSNSPKTLQPTLHKVVQYRVLFQRTWEWCGMEWFVNQHLVRNVLIVCFSTSMWIFPANKCIKPRRTVFLVTHMGEQQTTTGNSFTDIEIRTRFSQNKETKPGDFELQIQSMIGCH